MVQRVQVVALVAALAIGAAVSAGLLAGSRQVPLHVGPTALPAADLVDVYEAVLLNLVAREPKATSSTRWVRVSRAIYDTCLPARYEATSVKPSVPYARDPGIPPPPKSIPAPCGHTKVGELRSDVELALRKALARRGVDAEFREDGDLSLHQVISEGAGAIAADGDSWHRIGTAFHFKRVDGRLRLQSTSLAWIAEGR